MRPFLPTIIFSLLVAFLVALAYFDFQKGKEESFFKEVKDNVFPEIEGTHLDQVIFYNGQQTIEFRVEEGEWKIYQPQFDEGEDTKIDNFLMKILDQRVYSVQVEGDIPWVEYGLEEAAGYIQFKTKEGRVYRVDFSDETSFDGRYYLRRGDELLIGHTYWGSLKKVEFLNFKKEETKDEGKEAGEEEHAG